MEVIHMRCCGLDVHKRSVVACLRIQKPKGKLHKEIKTFETMTSDLLALSDWLAGHEVTHVAMESTGIYWKPIFNILEDQFSVILVNAAHIKTVPGRKTDVKDCEWIADLLAHGLLKGSFIPPVEIRDLRELTRYRKSLIDERAREVNRLQKLLETANIKLSSVATDVMGVSGRKMLDAILGGATSPEVLADLAKGRLRKKLPQLKKALEGKFRTHQRFLLAQILEHVDYLDEAIAAVSEEVAVHMGPFSQAIEILSSIPGIQRKSAEVIISEIGVTMEHFPTARHLSSWAGLCPGNNESAGKRKSGKTTKGNQWLRRVMIEISWAASRTKDTYLSAHYHRIARRRGAKKAAIAVAHTLLVIVYHMLKNKVLYKELGHDFLDKLNADAIKRHHVKRLESLGFKVSIEPLSKAA